MLNPESKLSEKIFSRSNKMNRNGFAPIFIIIAVAVVAAVIIGIVVVKNTTKNMQPAEQAAPAGQGTPTSSAPTVSGSTSTKPSITVLSPNGGETWQAGGNYSVTYQISNPPTADIGNWAVRTYVNCSDWQLGWGDTPIESHLLTNDTGVVNWTVPSRPSSNLCKATVELIDTTSGGMYSPVTVYRGSSNANFSIVLATPTPSVTVLSPNGGEVWQQGTTQTVKWTTFSQATAVNISLSSWSPACTTLPCPWYPVLAPISIASGTPDAGVFAWTIPKTVPAGNYQISVSFVYNGVIISDYSDAPFSIVAVSTTTNNL